MIVKIKKGIANGKVFAPPSKSMAHRLLICSMLCEGVSVVKGVSNCIDVTATLGCMNALGVKTNIKGNDVTVEGIKFNKLISSTSLDCKESGSTLRFMLPIALLTGKTVMFRGSKTLMQRPLGVYEKLCKERGLVYLADGQSVTVQGPLTSGDYTVVGNVSSQFISGLLFALPLLKSDSRIKILPPVESRSYIEMTRSAQELFGVQSVWEDDYTLFIKGGQKYKPAQVVVEGDYSGSAFMEALNLFNGKVDVLGLNPNSIQGDSVYKKYYEMLNKGVPTIHIGDCPDLGPVLFAISSAKNGGVFSGTKRLKIKESDRALAMAEELQKFGASVTVFEDKVVVYPASFHAPTEIINSHNDHRIAMACAVLLSMTGGEIKDAECVNKSYPGFFDDLQALGIGVERYGD